jgi:hypothetical protein
MSEDSENRFTLPSMSSQDSANRPNGSSALSELLQSLENGDSLVLDQFEAAAKALPNKMLQLNSALDGFSTSDLMGVVLFLRRGGSNLMFQLYEFDEHSAIFKAKNMRDKQDVISFSRSVMRRAPISFQEYLQIWKDGTMEEALPVPDKPPKGAMYLDLSPGKPIIIAIVSCNGIEISRAVSTDVLGLSSEATASAASGVNGRDHHPSMDPMKHQAVQKLAPATSAIFTGKCDNIVMNFQYVYECVVSGGFEVMGSVAEACILDMVMFLCLPKLCCLLLLAGSWIGLYHFRSMGSNSHYLEKEHASTACPRSEWSSWSVEVVEECWHNALRLYNRVFMVSAEFIRMWEGVWNNLRRLKVHQARYFPTLAIGSVVYEILDTLARNLFLMIGRQDLTSEQLLAAMHRCYIHETDATFLRLYNQLEKEYERGQKRSVVDVTSSDENPSKKSRGEKSQKGSKTDQKSTEDKDKSKISRGPCFSFLSQVGCSTAQCPFSHKPVSIRSDKNKSRIKEQMAARGLVPDDGKF